MLLTQLQYPQFLDTRYRTAWGYYTGATFWDTAIIPKLPLNTASNRRTMDEVRRVFQSVNIVQSVVNRHAKGLLGQDFIMNVVDINNNQQTEAEGQLNSFRRRSRSLPGIKKDPVHNAVINSLVGGVGYLRVFAPPKLRSKKNCDRLLLHSPTPESVVVTRDANEMIEYVQYYYSEGDAGYVEKQWLDEQGITQFEITRNGAVVETFSLNLGDRYSIYELSLDALVSESVMRNQDAINHALTMIPRVTEYAGFLRDIVLNGQPPGVWELDEQGRDRFVPSPEPMATGAGVVNYIQGTPNYDTNGNITGYSSPQVITHQPASISGLAENFKLFEAAIYAQVGQSHVLGSDLMLSGVSRQQQRADFVTQLEGDAQLLQEAIASVYTVILLMGNTERVSEYLDLTVNASVRLTVDKPLPEEQIAIREDFKAGLLSRKSAIALSGNVPDPDTEIDLIVSEQESRPDLDKVVDQR